MELEASTYVVRRCTPDQATTAAALLHAFNTEFDTPTPPVAVLTGCLDVLLPRDDIEVLLAGDPAVAIAVTTFRPSVWSAGPAALLEELYVRPDLRGHGIGGALLEHALGSARSRGAEWFEINVDEADGDAQRFYLAHGFSMLDPDTGDRAFYFSRQL